MWLSQQRGTGWIHICKFEYLDDVPLLIFLLLGCLDKRKAAISTHERYRKGIKGAAFHYRFTLEVVFSLLHSYLFFTVMTRMKLPSQQKNQTRSSFDLILNHTRLNLSWMFLEILACLGMQILNTRKWRASAWIQWSLGFIFVLS